MSTERHAIIGDLDTVIVEPLMPSHTQAKTLVVMLHGYAMQPSDLAPFAHSMGISARFLLPQAPLPAAMSGRAWWPIDVAARRRDLEMGARDLFALSPDGLEQARATMHRFVAEAASLYKPESLLIGGFSQGGMLACDFVLQDDFPAVSSPAVSGLFLLSASRIAIHAWTQRQTKLHSLPVFVSHGRADADLAFAAGERLRDFVADAGATLTWVPFDEGHEIPLIVWRQLRKFMTAIANRSYCD